MNKRYVLKIIKAGLVFTLASLLVFVPSLSNYMLSQVYAGTFTQADMTISDSRAGLASVEHDFDFTTTVTTGIKELHIIYCTSTTGACSAPAGIVTTGATRSADNIAGTGRTDTFGVNGTLNVGISTTAPQATQAVQIDFTGITNPSTADTSFYAHIITYSDAGSTEIDSAWVAGAVLTTTSISVTASIGPTFSFIVAGVIPGSDSSGIGDVVDQVNGSTLDITTTASTIPFGTLSTGDPNIGAHDLTVATNATNGFVVTTRYIDVGSSAPLVDGSNNIDIFTGTDAAPTTWSSPAGTGANVNTGFMGYTTEDVTLGTGTTNRFTSNKWAGQENVTVKEVFYNGTAPAGGTESERIGWQAEVNALQPAGNYTGTVILVATPTY
ncbi:hypothetical protein COY16_00500 [Candidatus Roizmanbacteria bacterium CG_4_10_14_0_2_um_filter_39_13]|uniref:WxL domain-containing protein n=1 Tax=Candidatus Roizmanbacteria bacterium CG_4_10_14_0_2_um_filter_39_13 TaxID=1974825 RepID=A0A2M7U1N2_9BACT|nr:MAG: hypothetical protein COY16_00500 [Candidatus Roizmanbacteria bacterium CG_4_10_14_0_2_um_filter_39_13]